MTMNDWRFWGFLLKYTSTIDVYIQHGSYGEGHLSTTRQVIISNSNLSEDWDATGGAQVGHLDALLCQASGLHQPCFQPLNNKLSRGNNLGMTRHLSTKDGSILWKCVPSCLNRGVGGGE